jgi:hypothetical protein
VTNGFYDFFDANPTGIFSTPCVDSAVIGGHVVVLVGWGTDPGGEHWIMQNSWGTNWGDGGFFRMRIDGSTLGLCGIQQYMYTTTGHPNTNGARRQKREEGPPARPPPVGAAVPLSPTAPLAIALGNTLAVAAAAQNPGFELAAVQSGTSQVIAGARFEVAIVGTDGTVISGVLVSGPNTAPAEASVVSFTSGGGGGGGGGGLSAGAITAIAVVVPIGGSLIILLVLAGLGLVAYRLRSRDDKYSATESKPVESGLGSGSGSGSGSGGNQEAPKSRGDRRTFWQKLAGVDVTTAADPKHHQSITARAPPTLEDQNL